LLQGDPRFSAGLVAQKKSYALLIVALEWLPAVNQVCMVVRYLRFSAGLTEVLDTCSAGVVTSGQTTSE